MIIETWWSNQLNTGLRQAGFKKFAQEMANRLMQGSARYGASVKKEHKYFTRLMLEAKAYKKTGNREHLRNIANYCVLESIAPEHPKHHDDTSVDSVTRNKK